MRQPKILIFDIETSPITAWTWGTYQTDVIKILKDWHVICYAYKWYGEKETHFEGNWMYSKNIRNDRKIMKKLRDLFDEADVIVGHNSDRFDIKKVNSRFLEYGLKPPSPYRTIDTMKEIKKVAAFSKNSLNEHGKYFKNGVKVEHEGFISMYEKLMNGCEKTQKTMEEYNIQDVVLTEQNYETIRPWMKNHPCIPRLKDESFGCKNCGSHNVQRRGFNYTQAGKFQRYQCTDCGAWSQERKSEKDIKVSIK